MGGPEGGPEGLEGGAAGFTGGAGLDGGGAGRAGGGPEGLSGFSVTGGAGLAGGGAGLGGGGPGLGGGGFDGGISSSLPSDGIMISENVIFFSIFVITYIFCLQIVIQFFFHDSHLLLCF